MALLLALDLVVNDAPWRVSHDLGCFYYCITSMNLYSDWTRDHTSSNTARRRIRGLRRNRSLQAVS